MNITLLSNSELDNVMLAIRTCWDSVAKSDSAYVNNKFELGDSDRKLITSIIKNGHTSTLEHLTFTFNIVGFSRDVLQEFSRHRVGVSPSVKSTRYTLKELLKESSFGFSDESRKRAGKYIVLTGKRLIDNCNIETIESVRKLLLEGTFTNDEIKGCLPGAYKTSGVYTFNARSLRHLFELRTHKRALKEFRILARELFNAIPDHMKFIFEDCIYSEQS